MKPSDRLISRLISEKIIPGDSYAVHLSGSEFSLRSQSTDKIVASSSYGVLDLLGAKTISFVIGDDDVRILDAR